MKPHESPESIKKSIRGDSRDSWPVWNRGICEVNGPLHYHIIQRSEWPSFSVLFYSFAISCFYTIHLT